MDQRSRVRCVYITHRLILNRPHNVFIDLKSIIDESILTSFSEIVRYMIFFPLMFLLKSWVEENSLLQIKKSIYLLSSVDLWAERRWRYLLCDEL